MDYLYLWLIISTFVVSFLIALKPFWYARFLLSACNVTLIGASIGILIVSDADVVLALPLVIIQGYHLFSVLRLAHRPSRYVELRKRFFYSTVVLALTLSSVLTLIGLVDLVGYGATDLLVILVSLQVVMAMIGLLHLKNMLRLSKIIDAPEYVSDKNLPSLTVALPARNETGELEDCLTSILNSNYPKMEVLVLDDCSQDSTAQVIRDFAHQGVRFIEGKAPPQSWLAKNHAYHQLLGEAEGKYILFCGVDVRFGEFDLRKIVATITQNNRRMCSFLPSRPKEYDDGFLLQPLRYYRELVLPKVFSKTPPVISTVWIAERAFLEKSGGFAAAKKTIRPERFFARIANGLGLYSFFIAGNNLGLYSIKSLRSQWNTAARTRYPECANQVERVFLTSLWYALLFLCPGVILISAIGLGLSAYVLIFSFIASIILLYIHATVNKLVTGSISIKKLVMLPASVILELIVLNYSMWAYEFSDVVWKGRNVCRPVLATIPRLPKI